MATEEPTKAAVREPTRRLFFALWPDESMRRFMAQATREAAWASGGRRVPADNLHVTLAFLGSVPEPRLVELAEVARATARSPVLAGGDGKDRLEVVFDHLEYWRAARLLCALPAEPPAITLALARRLQEELTARGFAPDPKPFRPHVTVVRNVLRPGLGGQIPAVAWAFNELALIESRTLPQGAVYSVVGSYLLQTGS